MSDAPNYRQVNEKLLRAVLRADHFTVTEFFSLSEEMRHQAWLSAWGMYQYNSGQSTASGQLIHPPRRPAIETSELENSEASFTSKEPSRSVPDENKVPDKGKIPPALGSLPPSIPETIETESEEIDELFAEWWELHGDNLDSAPDPAAIWPDCSSRILDEIRSRISIARSGKLNRFLADSDSSNAYFENSFSMSNLPLLEAGYHPIPGSHWKLVRRLDGGNTGFGVVWEGRNDRLGSRGVFKFCKDPLDDSTVAALHNELQKVHKLSHPGIVRVQNEHLDAEIPFLVFEYVEGIDLGRFLHRYFGPQPDGSPGKPLSIDNAASVILKLAEIVAYAHSNNVVHRDLKPANILVANSDELALLRALKVQSHLACSDLKVIDFGIGGHSRGERGTTIFQQSLGRQFDGFRTLMYASPEQCRGDAAEKSDDVYALGVIWYQLLAGDIHQPLPHGQHWHEGLLDVRAGHSEDLTAEQIALLNACLAHKKTNRIVDAVALKDRIREVYPNVPASQTFLDVLRHAVGDIQESSLTIPDMRQLAAETAAELVKTIKLRTLKLDDLTSLNAKTAAELVKKNFWTLELNGLTSLSVETAVNSLNSKMRCYVA